MTDLGLHHQGKEPEKMKKYSVFATVLAVCLMLSGCSGFSLSVSENLAPPKPLGELYEIQKTLETAVGHDVDLVYPSSGPYRSAIITKDIDSDGKYDVFSFYSTETDDKTTVMHINYIRWTDKKWVSVTDLQVDASGVESVEFVKLDKSATPKILVSWNRYSANNKQLSVYDIGSGELTEITSAEYSVYATCDLDSNGVSEIVAVYLDTEKKIAEATLLALGGDGFSAISRCNLDGSVTSYYTPVISKFTDGKQGLFVDADKATGMITEVLYLEKGQLKSAFKYTASNENVNTLRASSVRSADFDGDGCIDIPLQQKIPTVASLAEEDSAYLTVWNSFDGKVLTPQAHTVINYTDGYWLQVPENWVNSFAVERRISDKERIFYRYDPLLSELGEEIIRIRAMTLQEWEDNQSAFQNFKEIVRSSAEVYAVSFSNSAMNPGEEFMQKNLNLIEDGATKLK